VVWARDHIGQARKNIKANVDKMLATKVKTKGVSTQVPKTSNYVRVSLVCLVGSEQELDLKGFHKHAGHNYSDDIYKVGKCPIMSLLLVSLCMGTRQMRPRSL